MRDFNAIEGALYGKGSRHRTDELKYTCCPDLIRSESGCSSRPKWVDAHLFLAGDLPTSGQRNREKHTSVVVFCKTPQPRKQHAINWLTDLTFG